MTLEDLYRDWIRKGKPEMEIKRMGNIIIIRYGTHERG